VTVLISGASGLIGKDLEPLLQRDGHQVLRLTRSPRTASDIGWNPENGVLHPDSLEGIDAVIHLAGESIAAGRWNAARKARILASRVQGTTLLANTLSKLKYPPRVFVSASAVGYYGDRGNTILYEDSGPGEGFLPEVCQQWEAATRSLWTGGTRVVHTRIGIVLSTKGGALAKMLVPFRLGLGGKLGSGAQYMSWITLTDLCGVLRHALTSTELQGSVNAVAPLPVTNFEFTKALGSTLGRPTVAAVPGFAVRLLLGEMADALLLASTRVSSQKLEASGFHFQHRDIRSALAYVLKKRS